MFKIAKSLLGAIIIVAAVAFGVYLVMDSITYPQLKPVSNVLQTFTGQQVSPVVRSNTLLLKYNEYSCGDVELLYRGDAPRELTGLDYNRLKLKYPESQDWKLTFRDNELDITRKVNGFCGMHKEYRHLGMYEGKLAVFQGPLGYNDIVLSVVNIDLNLLPVDIKDKISRADRFDELPTAEQSELRKAIEFTSETEIYSVLENFDELERN